VHGIEELGTQLLAYQCLCSLVSERCAVSRSDILIGFVCLNKELHCGHLYYSAFLFAFFCGGFRPLISSFVSKLVGVFYYCLLYPQNMLKVCTVVTRTAVSQSV
jgi:hypothetical protein